MTNDIYTGDIDVIAAIGDGITSGAGANALTLFEMFIENRGLSFSIGGLVYFSKCIMLNQHFEMKINILFFRIQNFSHSSYVAQYFERIQSSISWVCLIVNYLNTKSVSSSSIRVYFFFRYSWGDAFSKERGAQLNMGENSATTNDMPFMTYKVQKALIRVFKTEKKQSIH